MKRVLASIAILLSTLLSPAAGYAATCGCAGVPLLSAIDTSSTEPGDLYLNLTTENHIADDLVVGTKDISDETDRKRSSLATTLSASYGLTEHWAVSGLLAYIEHSRDVGSSFLPAQHTSGLSDAVILFRYTPIYQTPFSRHEVSVGFGARIPIGKDDAGGLISAAEDMQPSVGALGKILWSSYSYAFNQAATVQLGITASYTDNDEENDRRYTFGDETSFSLGMSQSMGSKFSYAAAVRYRRTQPDRRLGFDIPNTGGEWLDFVPALQYAVTDKLNVALSGRLPIARDLNGAIQFTTSYSYSVSFTYAL